MRQPVHTVYGGAHLFKADTAGKFGKLALEFMQEYAPDARAFAAALGASTTAEISQRVYEAVRRKLESDPVEDFRIDFEDGFGFRPAAEEDSAAQGAARELARGMDAGSLPQSIGVRIKPFSADLRVRAERTLQIVLSSLLKESNGKFPPHFVITLPKVDSVDQVRRLAELLSNFESAHKLPVESLKLEIMIETPQAIVSRQGDLQIGKLVQAGEGRCIAAHFGPYDYSASLGISAQCMAAGAFPIPMCAVHCMAAFIRAGIFTLPNSHLDMPQTTFFSWRDCLPLRSGFPPLWPWRLKQPWLETSSTMPQPGGAY